MASPTTLRPYASTLPYKRISFPTYDGTILRGNLYHTSASASPAPIVIFIHGIGLLKEQYLENWFKHCIQAGYHVLIYDHRTFGDSDGVPRNTFDWMGQTEDFVDAVTYVRELPEVREEKVFAWGVAHAGGVVGMAAALDARITGIIMFLPCINGAWDKSRWGNSLISTSTGEKSTLSDAVQRNRFQLPSTSSRAETVRFWPLTETEANGTGGSVLSGTYVRDWSVVAQRMASQAGNDSFIGELTLSSFYSDFACRPANFFSKIAPTPLLWVMASEDVVCGPLEVTMGVFESLPGPKEVCILEGEHLAQYFSPGFDRSVEAMISFLGRYTV